MSKRDFNARPRVDRGFYATPLEAFEPLAKVWTPPTGSRVVEPCAGDGALCGHMANAGWGIAWAGDTVPQHPDVAQLDALAITNDMLSYVGHFVTNPPWPLPGAQGQPTRAIIDHLSNLRPTWALLPADWMHNVCNEPLMRRCTAIVSIGRVKWIAGTDKKGFDNVCWYYFDAEDHGTEFNPDAEITSFPVFIGRTKA